MKEKGPTDCPECQGPGAIFVGTHTTLEGTVHDMVSCPCAGARTVYRPPLPPRPRPWPKSGDHYMRRTGCEQQRLVLVRRSATTDQWVVRLVSGDGRLSDETMLDEDDIALGTYEKVDPIPTREPTEQRVTRGPVVYCEVDW